MNGVDQVDESLGHDKTQDEAHADHYGIRRGTYPAKKEGSKERYMKIHLGGSSSAITTQMRVP